MRILALDIGNTSCRFGIVDSKNRTCLQRIETPTLTLRTTIDAVLHELPPDSHRAPVAICSVVPALSEWALHHLSNASRSVQLVKHTAQLPLTINYSKPDLLGADRLANSLFCVHTWPNQSVIIIDVGTAIKVDFVNRGKSFEGGSILPGIRAQFNALHTSTAALPPASSSRSEHHLPGRCTQECMESGIIYGSAGAVERIVRELQNIDPASVIAATGGAWPLLSNYVNIPFQHVPNMTIIGTAFFIADLL